MSNPKLRAVILIISTTASQTPSTSTSGPLLQDVFQDIGANQWEVVETKIVGDVIADIQRTILSWTDRGGDEVINLIVSTGGTGFAVFDNTPEAITPILHRHAPGLVHAMMAASLSVTPFAAMSRPVAGVRNKTIIVTLPGSPKGAKENLSSILKLLPHACLQAAGGDSRSMHQGGVKKLEEEAGISSKDTASSSGHTHGHDGSHSTGHSHNHSHHHHHHGGHAMPIRHTQPSSTTAPRSNDPTQGPSQRHRESPYPMVTVSDAISLIKTHTPPPGTTTAPVDSNLIGSILASDITATEAVPAYRASIVDGYAIHVPDNQSTTTAGTFPVSQISHATPGEIPHLQPGTIARITTGGPLPPGATSVVMVEDTLLISRTPSGTEENLVEILAPHILPGQNVREIGSDIKANDIILRAGEEITSTGGELGLLASVGLSSVPIFRKPVVGILSTGDEIIPHDTSRPLRLGEVRDCNRPTILAAVRGWGYECHDLGIVSDTSGSLEEALRNALRRVDVIITTGGVSMGELDLLKPTIERSLGGTIHFGRVAMKPGKPTTFATIPFKTNSGTSIKKVIFSLPGNPASAIVTLHLFVLPSLHFASGIEPAGLPSVTVQLAHEIALDLHRAEYHRAVVMVGRDGGLWASSTGSQRSSRVGSLRSANALLCLPAEAMPMAKGTKVQALLMGKLKTEL